MKHENDRLDAVKESFRQWRCTRIKKGPIPEDLWQAAAELRDSHPLCKIAKELKLDYNLLKRRIRQGSPQPQPSQLPQDQPSQFIEVRMDGVVPVSQCSVHLRSPEGFELTVQGCNGVELQLLEIMARFLSQGR